MASTCRQAALSSLAAHNILARDVATLTAPESGWLTLPAGAGLGLAVDETSVAALRDAPPVQCAGRITIVVYPDGERWHFGSEQQRHETFYFGSAPGFVRGVRLETWEDDGSADSDDLLRRCQEAPIVSRG